jgi:hypothetical protein
MPPSTLPITADGDVVLDVGRVDLPVAGQEQAGLAGVEGNVLLALDRLPGFRIGIEQPLHDPAVLDRLGQDLGDVLHLDPGVEEPLRLDLHQRALFAQALAAGEAHLDRQPAVGDLFLELVGQDLAAIGAAAGATADSDYRPVRVARL